MLIRILAAVALVVAACSSVDEPTNVPDCSGLADRWLVLNQEYLDRLGGLSPTDTREIEAADSWLGSALLEQARDAAAIGCEDEVSSRAPAICERAGQLVAAGSVAELARKAVTHGCG